MNWKIADKSEKMILVIIEADATKRPGLLWQPGLIDSHQSG
jgi:hypothetical protein